MSSQFYYRYIQVGKMMLRHKTVLGLVESENGADARSKRLVIRHSGDIGLDLAITEELPVLSRVPNNALRNPN